MVGVISYTLYIFLYKLKKTNWNFNDMDGVIIPCGVIIPFVNRRKTANYFSVRKRKVVSPSKVLSHNSIANKDKCLIKPFFKTHIDKCLPFFLFLFNTGWSFIIFSFYYNLDYLVVNCNGVMQVKFIILLFLS